MGSMNNDLRVSKNRKGRWTLGGYWVSTIADVCEVRLDAVKNGHHWLIPQCDSLLATLRKSS